ncbi:NAD(P)H-dependent flavin oxidoreductase [Anaerobium acetethylicum]|uniref:Probable nitronate monooxygenase n=1 Tax=Anaerobium acetethylicum TaxID=1619234 RepID=A0A1D3TNH9_9FIRM|nr:nitronate monooxygenase [Anaerobium acetethylicum]SCP94858.1 enoyl-[acyl-carrier protein] reductase II [Anaerobium acetethylicum]
MNQNRVTEILNIKYPVIQASMSWITSAELAAAVSNAGGMGILGPNAGQTTLTIDSVETAERMRHEIRKTKELTDKPFAVQYFIPFPGDTQGFSSRVLQVIREEGIKNLLVLGMSLGNEAEEVRNLKNEGFTIIYRDLNPTVESAMNIEAAGADIIIATGYDEGGGLPVHAIGTMTIVPLIADAIDIPVLAAGGIVDNRGVKASMILGAEGVYIGTRFVASKECPASDISKQDILNAKTTDLVEFKAMPAWRSTPHKLSLELYNMDQNGASSEEINKRMGSIGGIRAGMLEGNLDNGINSVSNAIELIKDINSCKEIIEELMRDVAY